MRRLQVNLAYLASMADSNKKKPGAPALPTSPAILIPPPDMPDLVPLYKDLQGLFPGVNPNKIPIKGQMGPPAAGPGAQGQAGPGSQQLQIQNQQHNQQAAAQNAGQQIMGGGMPQH